SVGPGAGSVPESLRPSQDPGTDAAHAQDGQTVKELVAPAIGGAGISSGLLQTGRPGCNPSLLVEPVRIGIIGAGGVARSIHAPGFRLCPNVELTAVCDPDRAAAGSLGISRTFARVEDLLGASDVDAVVVATPNFLHREIACAALAAGKHVLCEKP